MVIVSDQLAGHSLSVWCQEEIKLLSVVSYLNFKLNFYFVLLGLFWNKVFFEGFI